MARLVLLLHCFSDVVDHPWILGGILGSYSSWIREGILKKFTVTSQTESPDTEKIKQAKPANGHSTKLTHHDSSAPNPNAESIRAETKP